MVSSDGKIRPYFDCLASYTGRIFAEHPQIQYVPKGKFLNGHSCRSIFRASNGHTLLSFDFKQVELRMLAAISGDEKLCTMLKSNTDPFEHITQRLNSMENARKFNRDQTKRIFYALLYGMATKTLAQELGCSIEETDIVIGEIFHCFKGARLWIENVTSASVKNGFIQSIWGLSVSTDGLTEFEIRQKAPHFVIQATVSELVRRIMNEVEKTIDSKKSL